MAEYIPGISKQKSSDVGGVRDYARATLGQGLMFGFGDEAEAFVKSLVGDREYDEIVQEVRADINRFREEQPVAAYGAEIGGAILPAVLSGGTTLAARGGLAGAQTAAKTIKPITSAIKSNPIKSGATQGALYGAGTSEGGVVDRLPGAAIGGTLGGGVTGVAQKVLPRVTPSARKLLEEDVPLTPGQSMGGKEGGIIGGGIKIGEEALSSVPGTGVNTALRKGQEAFNRQGFKKAIEGIKGIKVDDRLPVNQLYKSLQRQLSKKYDEVVPNLKIPNVQATRKKALNILNSSGLDFKQRSMIVNRYLKPLENRNQLKGKEVQKLLQQIKRDIKTKQRSDKVGVIDESEVLKQMQDILKNNTSGIKQLNQVDNAYQQIQTLGDAAIKSADDLYTPAQLRSAIKGADQSRGKIQFKRGDAKLQDFSETAQDVLGRMLPDSGTATRGIAGYGLLGGTGAVGGTPGSAALAMYLALLQNPYTNIALREGIDLASQGAQKTIPYASGQASGLIGY
jgi:hypothetical protein